MMCKSVQSYLTKSVQKYLTVTAKRFYTFLQDNSGKQEFDLTQLKDIHIELYKKQLKDRVEKKEITHKTYEESSQRINYFIEYLIESSDVKVKYIPSTKNFDSNIPLVIQEFEKDLTLKNYAFPDIYIREIRYFNNFLNTLFIENGPFQYDCLTSRNIKSYEKFLVKRMVNEEISRPYVYNLLLSLRHFLNFLYLKKIIHFRYTIPEKFRANAKRSNEYVPIEDTIDLLQTIMTNSRLAERNIAIVLILIDIGCRPIEITNLKISDFCSTESTIVLWSKKSGQRKLKICDEVKLAIQKYMRNREKCNSQDDYLFLSNVGRKLSTSAIRSVLYSYNIKVFNQAKHSAKSYRHTYITNILDNGYSLDHTAEIVGHKHLISTLYYEHRSVERMKKNTMSHNPVSKFSKEGL